MARVLGIAIITAASAGGAFAADYRAPLAPAAQYYHWAGFYLGGNFGYGLSTASAGISLFGVSLDTAQNLDGYSGGVQAGFNFQSGAIVYGLESDFQFANQKNTFTTTTGGLSASGVTEIPWFATLRARFGIAADNLLVYGTGGLAFSELKSSGTASAGGAVATWSGYEPQVLWTLGGGIETALWASNWTAKVEYLYLNSIDITTTTIGIATGSHASNSVLRAGINYRFGGP